MPRTEHLFAVKAGDIAHAAQLLREGGLVAFATETVYGLGANALDPAAVGRIFAAKARPSWDPLIVHLPDASQCERVATIPRELQARIESLAARFWPGPLTLLLPRSAAVPDAVTAGRRLVGVRVPAHAAALALLREAGVPVAAPSANRFGHVSPSTAAHVLADLGGRIDAVLDAGPTNIGVESTVLDPTQTPMVLYRPGAISAAELAAATGVAVHVFQPRTEQGTEPTAMPSPGVGIRHYAPSVPLVLVECGVGEPREPLLHAAEAALRRGERVGVLLPDCWPCAVGAVVVPWGAWHDPLSLAHGLFAGLRSLEDAGVTLILAPLPLAGDLRDAIRDRLLKAARLH